MRLLVVSHTYVTKMSQEKIQALTEFFGNVAVAVPFQIKDTLRTIHYEEFPGAKFQVFKLKTSFDWHNSLRLYSEKDIENVLKQFRPDVVLLEQEPYSLSTYQWLNKKQKYQFRTLLFSFQNIFKKYPVPFRWIEQKNLKFTDTFIAGCESVKPVWIRKGFPADRMSILPQVGINENEFAPAPNRTQFKDKFGLKNYAVTYAGRFVREKGLMTLIQAFSKARLPNDAQLVFVGKGPLKDEMISEIKRLNLTWPG